MNARPIEDMTLALTRDLHGFQQIRAILDDDVAEPIDVTEGLKAIADERIAALQDVLALDADA